MVKKQPRFKISYSDIFSEYNDNKAEEVNTYIDWGGQSKTPLSSYPHDLLKKITYYLLVGSPNIGDKINTDSFIHAHTEIKKGTNIV